MATLAEQLFKKGELKGKLEGKREGIEETLETINLIQAGLDNAAISEKTQLGLEVVARLRQKVIH